MHDDANADLLSCHFFAKSAILRAHFSIDKSRKSTEKSLKKKVVLLSFPKDGVVQLIMT